MEFNKKLQELRHQKGLTQEQLAEKLFVSRTAVSKWEQGKGYPSLESLKAIANIFSVTVDELLSTNELLSLADEESKTKSHRLCDLLFGLFDIFTALLLFLPFFAEKTDRVIKEVSLLSLTSASSYLTALYFILVGLVTAFGVLTLALQNCKCAFWLKIKSKVSIILSLALTLVFIISLQPYAAVYALLFLVIKAMTLKVSAA